MHHRSKENPQSQTISDQPELDFGNGPLEVAEANLPFSEEPKPKPKPEPRAARERSAAPQFDGQRTRPLDLAEELYLRDVEVAARFGCSRQTVWRWSRTDPHFPAPVKLGPGTTRWRLSDLLAYEAQLEGVQKTTSVVVGEGKQ